MERFNTGEGGEIKINENTCFYLPIISLKYPHLFEEKTFIVVDMLLKLKLPFPTRSILT